MGMNKSVWLIGYVVISLGMTSCNSPKADPKPAPVESNVKPSNDLASLPSLTPEWFYRLVEECDYIDYIFYDLPISISQDEKSAINSNLALIAKTSPQSFNQGCKPIGRKLFHHDGEVILEADMYFDPVNKCNYYVFLVDNKPTYINLISQQGINFYMNVFNQAGVKL